MLPKSDTIVIAAAGVFISSLLLGASLMALHNQYCPEFYGPMGMLAILFDIASAFAFGVTIAKKD